MFYRTLQRSLVLLAIVGLGLSLTYLFGWGVIGKYQLDEDARGVYKATRAVRSDPVLHDVHAAHLTVNGDEPPPAGHPVTLLQLACDPPPAPQQSYSPSRAPPGV